MARKICCRGCQSSHFFWKIWKPWVNKWGNSGAKKTEKSRAESCQKMWDLSQN